MKTLFILNDAPYGTERMIKAVAVRGGELGVCGSCMGARGITDAELAADTHRSTLDELTDWVQWADSVVTF